MNISDRILQSIRSRKDGVLLRSDVHTLGSSSQISVALRKLCQMGLLERIAHGAYATPQKIALLGKLNFIEGAQVRLAQLRRERTSRKMRTRRELTPTARYVQDLANRLGISYMPTYGDQWAEAVTRLAGDVVSTDSTDDLLVALTRAGKLSPIEMTKLVMEHHRTLRSRV